MEFEFFFAQIQFHTFFYQNPISVRGLLSQQFVRKCKKIKSTCRIERLTDFDTEKLNLQLSNSILNSIIPKKLVQCTYCRHKCHSLV